MYLNDNVIKLHKIVKVKEQSYFHIDKGGANFDTNLDRERLAMSCDNKSRCYLGKVMVVSPPIEVVGYQIRSFVAKAIT